MFAKITKTENQNTFKRTNYIRLTEGKHNIRILDAHATEYFQHFLFGKYPVKCLRDDCPVCKNNLRITMENPDGYRDDKRYSYAQKRYVFNALDRTLGKVCPNCGVAIKSHTGNYPSVCPSCNTFMGEVEEAQINKVGLITCPQTIIQNLIDIDESVLDADRNKIGLKNYDVTFVISGYGRDKQTSIIPNTHLNDDVGIGSDELFNHDTAAISLTVNEIEDLLRGVQLRDIFAARRTSEEEKPATEEAKFDSKKKEDVMSAKTAENIVNELLNR